MFFSRQVKQSNPVAEIKNQIIKEGENLSGILNHAEHLQTSQAAGYVGLSDDKSDYIGWAWDEIDAVKTMIKVL